MKTYGRKRFIIVTTFLLAILIAAIFTSLNTGTLSINPQKLLNTLLGGGTKQQQIALFTIRLPRIIISLLVGGALAVSGISLQSITGNDLAEPGILGINSGSAFFVVIYIYLTNGKNYYAMAEYAIYTMPFIALLGGLFAAALIYLLAWKKGGNSQRLLLMGIAIHAAFSALIIIAQLSFDNNNFNTVLQWTSGSIWGIGWKYVIAVFPLIFLLSFIVIYKSRYLDVFTLGDEISTGLGVNVEKERLLLLILSVALAAAATSVAGSVAFVGLMAPHIAKKLTGPIHKYTITTAILTGMLLVVTADTIARNLFAPIELHLGIVVSIIGVPYFIYLVLKQ